MDAALLLRDARRDSGCPALVAAGVFKPQRPQTGGLLFPVSVRHAFTDPLRAGEDLLTEEVFPRSACGLPSGFLPLHLHRAADPHREHQHPDGAGEGGVRHAAGGALHPGSVFWTGVPQRAVKTEVADPLHPRPCMQTQPGGHWS